MKRLLAALALVLAACTVETAPDLVAAPSAGLMRQGAATVDLGALYERSRVEVRAAMSTINAAAGSTVLVELAQGADRPADMLAVNENLGDSSKAGETDCRWDPCLVKTNYRYENDRMIWAHELIHALGYVGDADGVHDAAGLMADVPTSTVIEPHVEAWLSTLPSNPSE